MHVTRDSIAFSFLVYHLVSLDTTPLIFWSESILEMRRFTTDTFPVIPRFAHECSVSLPSKKNSKKHDLFSAHELMKQIMRERRLALVLLSNASGTAVI